MRGLKLTLFSIQEQSKKTNTCYKGIYLNFKKSYSGLFSIYQQLYASIWYTGKVKDLVSPGEDHVQGKGNSSRSRLLVEMRGEVRMEKVNRDHD